MQYAPPTDTHTHPGWSHMWGLIKRTQTALDRIGDTKQLHLRQLHFTFNYLVMAIDKWRHHKCVSHGPLKVQTDSDDLHGLTRHSGIRFVFALYSLFALLAECTRQIRISLSLPPYDVTYWQRQLLNLNLNSKTRKKFAARSRLVYVKLWQTNSSHLAWTVTFTSRRDALLKLALQLGNRC